MLSSPQRAAGAGGVQDFVSLHFLVLLAGHHLLWHLPRCYFLQGPRLHDDACSMGDQGQGSRREDEPASLHCD